MRGFLHRKNESCQGYRSRHQRDLTVALRSCTNRQRAAAKGSGGRVAAARGQGSCRAALRPANPSSWPLNAHNAERLTSRRRALWYTDLSENAERSHVLRRVNVLQGALRLHRNRVLQFLGRRGVFVNEILTRTNRTKSKHQIDSYEHTSCVRILDPAENHRRFLPCPRR